MMVYIYVSLKSKLKKMDKVSKSKRYLEVQMWLHNLLCGLRIEFSSEIESFEIYFSHHAFFFTWFCFSLEIFLLS